MDLSITHYLGRRAFLLFLARRIKLVILVLAVSVLLLFVQDKFSPMYAEYADFAVKLGFMLFAGIFIARLVQTYIEYRGHSYKFDKEFFQVNHGYIVKNEIAIVYHHIQNAVIRRDLFDRAIGVSKLVVVMDGSKEMGGEKDIVLPAIDRRRAKSIQKELMRQARIHSVRALHSEEEKKDEYVYLGDENEEGGS